MSYGSLNHGDWKLMRGRKEVKSYASEECEIANIDQFIHSAIGLFEVRILTSAAGNIGIFSLR